MSASPAKQPKMAGSFLDQLKTMTKVVADTGDFTSMKEFHPEDATTNPSLILKASGMPQYKHLLEDSVKYAKQSAEAKTDEDRLELAMDRLAVGFGLEILKIVPGYVSTEVDARLSFDAEASVRRAKRIIKMYEEAGVSRTRILIKLATTWEGLVAARELQKDGIICNMTLLFSFAQAVACAEAGVHLISPFVGRILDWFKKAEGKDSYEPSKDPGVVSVTRIYKYYKAHGYKTIVMGASFRNIDEITELSGCDRLTIAPALLKELAEKQGELPRRLTPDNFGTVEPKISLDEKAFRWMMNEDAMATEKLAEGIRQFGADIKKLEEIVRSAMKV